MMGFLFINLFGIMLAAAGLLFGILAYNRRVDAFFWLGIGTNILLTLGIIINAEYYYYSLIESQGMISMMTVGGWIISSIFLVLAKVNKKPNDDNITDAFLDEVINSEDEDWDAAS